MACGLHNLYRYFLIFKDIVTAQGLACISLSARGSGSAITEQRKFLVALRRGRKGFRGNWKGQVQSSAPEVYLNRQPLPTSG